MLALVVHAGPESLAVPARAVVEVVPAVHLHPAAGAPAWVAGLARYRGAVVPVVDLVRVATGKPCPDRLSARLVILDAPTPAGPRRLGLLVDRADDLTDLPESAGGYAPPAPAGHPDLGPVVSGAAGVVRLPDLAGLAGIAFPAAATALALMPGESA